jgi:hypothetical protein
MLKGYVSEQVLNNYIIKLNSVEGHKWKNEWMKSEISVVDQSISLSCVVKPCLFQLII